MKFKSIVAFLVFIQLSYLILSLFGLITFELDPMPLAVAFFIIGALAVWQLLKSQAKPAAS